MNILEAGRKNVIGFSKHLGIPSASDLEGQCEGLETQPSCTPEPKPSARNAANYLPKLIAPIRAGCRNAPQRAWERDASESYRPEPAKARCSHRRGAQARSLCK